VPLAGHGLRPAALRRRAGRPQLKRDPLGGGTHDCNELSSITLLRCVHRVRRSQLPCLGASSPALGDRRRWSHGAVSNAALDARLAAAALQYRSYAPVPRIAFFDLAYPKDSTEAAAMHGYAVLVVTAVVQDSTELPLPHVYVRSVNGDRELPLVARVASWLPVSDTIVRPTFGRFRLDASYLLPIAARASQGDLLVDFATHRQGFRLIHFAGDVPEPVRRLQFTGTPSGQPAPSTVWAMVQREYPDLAAALLPKH